MQSNTALSLRVTAVSLMLFTITPGKCGAWPWSNEERKAEKYLAAGKLDEAAKHYQNALLRDPDNPAIEYNLGNVLHMSGKWEESLAQHSKVMAGPRSDLKEMTLFNMGNTHYVTGDFQRAIESYRDALLSAPDDYDAKYNLEMALRSQKEQENREEKGEKKEQEKREEKKGEEESKESEKGSEPKEEREPSRGEGEISKEEALRILNALDEQEKEDRRESKEARPAGRVYVEKDW